MRALAAAVLAVAFALASAPGLLAAASPRPPRLTVRARAVNVAKDGQPGCTNLYAWSDRRLAAQTIVVPVQETAIGSAAPAVAEGAGGILLFGSQAPADLGTQLQRLRAAVPEGLGLLVMTDEEGGGVQRMADLVGDLPWARDMAANWTAAQTTANLAAVASRMASYGVNMDLAPVVDVDGRDEPPSPANPDGWRSFGGDTSVVTRYGVAYMKGLLQGGVIPVLKHFPGLGGATGNTDNGPAQTLPWPTLQQVGLPPFVEGIAQGAPAVMVSNAVVPGLTALPASLSSAAIAGELRGTLHFDGLVITDSLSAGAISALGLGVPAAAVQALEAGADVVIYNADTPADAIALFHATLDAEVKAVTSGALPRARVQEAATHALTVRGVAVCE